MRRTLRPLAALAMVALLSAGCSNAAAQTGTGRSGGSTTTNRDQAVKFAKCMRANGVREFPDPNASGELTIDGIANGSSLDPSTAAFKQAISACRDLEPPGLTGHKRSAQEQDAPTGRAWSALRNLLQSRRQGAGQAAEVRSAGTV